MKKFGMGMSLLPMNAVKIIFLRRDLQIFIPESVINIHYDNLIDQKWTFTLKITAEMPSL